MDIRVICTINDDDDIRDQALSRFAALSDHVYIVVQTPGKRATPITASVQRPAAVSSYILPQKGYFRLELAKVFAHLAFAQGADWVLFADADEFLRIGDRSDLEQALSGHANAVVNFRRRNLVPSAFGSMEGFRLGQTYRTLAAPSGSGKVAISAGWASRFPQFELASNLTAVAPWRGAMPISGVTVGEYLHIPVRSLDRLRAKVEAGIAAHDLTLGSDDSGAAHWRRIRERLAGHADDATLADIALHYESPASTETISPVRAQTVEETAFIDGTIPVDGSTGEKRINAAREPIGGSVQPAPVTSGPKQALLSGRIVEIALQPVSGRGAARSGTFGTLPAGVQLRLDQSRCIEAIGAAFQCIETPLAGDAAIHIPALFFLWRLLAPRRYVELGSRQGTTFFAACQAAKGQREIGECIAIDSWDRPMAGPDGYRLFADFEYLLATRYPHVGHYVRGQTGDAARCFEDGSIDLLFIDGCRDGAAVEQDVETWRPKLSDRGVILLHGTAANEIDTGVTRWWKEMEASHASWNLRVGRGLGVVYVGDPESEAARLLTGLAADARWCEILTEMASGTACLSLAEASRAVGQLLTEERLATEKEMAATQATGKMRASLSWRVTAPLRLAGRVFRRAGWRQ